MDIKNEIKNNRKAIKPTWTDLHTFKTDRHLGLERPALFKELEGIKFKLQKEFPNIDKISLTESIKNRRSTRKYSKHPLSFEEVSYLLYETSRVDFVKNESAVFRTIPTGGATNAMETYVYVNNLEGIKQGLYHYAQNKHELTLIEETKTLKERVNSAMLRQLREASIVVFFTAVPYRSEYKYAHTAHKMIMIEAGHAAQNLSLSCEAINSGAVCIAAYNQELCDNLLQIDGEEEFTTYVVALGKKV